MIKRVLILLLAIALPVAARGQAVPFVYIPSSADNLALGASHVATPFHAPLEGHLFEAGIGKTLWQTKGAGYNLTTYAARVSIVPQLTAGISVTTNSMAEINIYSENGQPTGTAQPNEMCAAASLSYSPMEGLGLYAAGKYIRSALTDSHEGHAAAFDAGVTYSIGHIITVGVRAENVGQKIDYGYGAYSLPTTYKAGIYGNWPLAAKHAVELAADAGLMPAGSAALASIGTGYIFNNMIAVRCGAHISAKADIMPTFFSVGAFFASDIFDFGAAYLTAADTFTLSARFKL